MINKTTFILALFAMFGFGFAFNSILTPHDETSGEMVKVTGIGGVFFKSKDPKKLNEWYNTHLGIDAGAYGATFEWREAADPSKMGATQWTTFPEKTTYFAPSTKDFMINYRVANLEALLVELQKEGVTIVDKMETYDYGKFIHIMDLEGNKIQLWEPLD